MTIENPSGIMESPEGALFHAEQNLFYAGDTSSCFVVSVHARDAKAYCNFWVRSDGQWRRLMDERVMDDPEPDQLYLVGEVTRLAQDRPDLLRKIEEDLHMNLGIRGLMDQVTRLTRP